MKTGHVDLAKQAADRLRCKHLINRFDDLMSHYESKWGVEVLPGLVNSEIAANWEAHINDLNDAITRADPYDLQIFVDGAARGLEAMEGLAITAGHKPTDSEFWAAKLNDGRELRIYRSVLDSRAPTKKGVVRYALAEIAEIISGLDTINEVKEQLGGVIEK